MPSESNSTEAASSSLYRYFSHSNRPVPRERLRVGVMLNGDSVIRPFATVLQAIAQSDFAEITVIFQPEQHHSQRRWIGRRILYSLLKSEQRRHLLYEIYQQLDAKLHPKLQAYLGDVNADSILGRTPKIVLEPNRKGFVDRFDEDDLRKVRDLNLDVLLRFGYRILKGDILKAVRYGVWSYHHGDNTRYRGAPPAFWELYEGAELGGAILQILTETLDGGIVIGKVLTPVLGGYSVQANRVAPYLSAEPLVIQKLKQLHEEGFDSILRGAIPDEPYQGRRALYRRPNNSEMIRFCGGVVKRSVAVRLARLKRFGAGPDSWHVGLRCSSNIPPWTTQWANWKWIEAPRMHYYADPILWSAGNRTFLFVEDFDQKQAKGIIAAAELDENGNPSPFRPALEAASHLSFPFLLRRDGELFMIPESKAVGRVDLYRAVSFPFTWKFEKTLLDLPGVDSVIFMGKDGTEFLLTSIAAQQNAHASLYLFYADSLFGAWKLHPASPICGDARYSRNAGPIIDDGAGTLIRISQDASRFYGRQMHFHEIQMADRNAYSEKLIGRRDSAGIPNSKGTHTFSRTERWEATDALIWKSR